MKKVFAIEERENGFVIVRKLPESKTNYRELVAIFENQPDGSIIRTFSDGGFPNVKFPDLDTIMYWYGMK